MKRSATAVTAKIVWFNNPGKKNAWHDKKSKLIDDYRQLQHEMRKPITQKAGQKITEKYVYSESLFNMLYIVTKHKC